MKIVVRVGKCLAFCLLALAGSLSAQTPVVSQTNLTLRIMAANLTSGGMTYQTAGLNILKGLKPDIVAIQEFNYANNSAADFRQMLDTTFDTNFVYYRESGYGIPNGIISRFPILAAGSWDDPEVNDRGFAWAQLDVPGSNDLYVVSVHLYNSGNASDRNNEAIAVKNNIAANFPANAWVVVAGDFNTDTRSEAAVNTFKTFLSDDPIPTDAQSGGDMDTNEPRNKPYDYVLPSFSFATNLAPVVLPSRVYANGLVFDSAVYTPLSDVAPVSYGDSHVSGMQHMAVIKDFTIAYTITNSYSDAPAITAQPESQTVEPGGNAAFTVVASGAPTLHYQWRFGTSNLAGATASTLTLTNVQSGNAGTYCVVITNFAGSVTSSPATLTVGTAPVIVTHPQSQSVNAGATVAFSVTSSGTALLAYQWRFNGANLAGATESSCLLTNVQSQDAGSYSVVITNLLGATTSSNAVLTVNAPPIVTAQPQSQTVAPGQDATFTVTATGAAPLSYQWRFNGTPLAGAIGTSYTRPNAQPSDAGSYSVVITNLAGSAVSVDAILTVAVAQGSVIAQWDFNSLTPDGLTTTGTLAPSTGSGTATYVGGTKAAASGEFAGGGPTDTNTTDNSGWNTSYYPAATVGNKTAGVKFAASTVGRQNVGVSWDQRESSTGSKYVRLRYTTNGTDFIDFPTAVSVAGTSWKSTTNSLASVGGVNDNPSFAFQIVAEFESTATGAGNTNYVGAAGTYSTGGTIRFDMVTVSGTAIPTATPPVISSQPASQMVNQGAAATFSVLAAGTAPLSYQWRFNASVLPGATASAYTRSNVQPADIGSYSVVVSNSAGTAISSNALLHLVVPAPALAMESAQVIRWQGLSNLTYIVQAITNIEQTNWVTVGTASSPGTSVSFTNQAEAPRQFFRVLCP